MVKSNKVPLIKKNGEMLIALSNSPQKFRRNIIVHAPNELINSICECCKNVLKGNVSMSNGHTSQLKAHSKHIRKLADHKISIKQKKKILNNKNNSDLLSLLGTIIKPILKEI